MSASRLFDSAAVFANREGQLTPTQRDAYISMSTSGKGGWLTLAIAGVMLVAIVLEFGKQLMRLQGAAQILGFAVILGVLIVAATIVSKIYAIPARHRADSAQVERLQGQVTFDHGQYVPLANGKRLRSVYSDESHLLPGNYAFYCLRGTNWLVSIEKLADAVTGTAVPFEFDPARIADLPIPEQYKARAAEVVAQQMEQMKTESSFDLNGLRAALASANGFDQAALEMNRGGKLTRTQIKRLRQEGGSYLRWGLVFLIALVAFLAYVVTSHKPLDLGGLAAVVLFFGGVGLVLIALSFRESRDARKGIVEMTEGAVHKFTRSTHGSRGEGTTHYYYGVNNLSFEVSHAGYEALIEHVRYRIYYMPVSKQLASIEPVT